MAERPATRYLVLSGTLHPDNRVALRAGHLTEDAEAYQGEVRSPVVAELLDERGHVLARHGLPAASCCSGAAPSPDLAMRGAVPFPPGTRTVRLLREGVPVHELRVSGRTPEVRLTWRPPEVARGRLAITWDARPPENEPLEFFLRYANAAGAGWRRVGGRTSETRALVDFDELPGGERCRIAVVATSGVDTAVAESAPFAVPVKPCRAIILGPVDGTRVESGTALRLHGQGFYLEESAPEREALVWTSSRDGEVGRGMVVDVPGLSSGEHRIELTAGTGARAGKAAIRVIVAAPSPRGS